MKLDKLCKNCKKCNNCKEGYVQRTKDLTHIIYFCPKFLYNDGKPFTNADRIRSMSDEELLNFICSIETYDKGKIKYDKQLLIYKLLNYFIFRLLLPLQIIYRE